MVRTSTDNGRTWSDARRLPEGILGPVKNKPVRLADGTIIAPSSTETPETPSRWRVHFERTRDGRSWSVTRPPASEERSGAGQRGPASGATIVSGVQGSPRVSEERSGAGQPIDAIQPSILIHSDGRLQAVGRTRSGRVFETWSGDSGQTWTPVALSMLPNPSAGTDAVTLNDGRHLIVYNHASQGRSPLNVAVSRDGIRWDAALVLESEPGEYSYPAVIQTSDGLVHITYTWRRRRIKHVVIDPRKLQSVPMRDGNWP
jgi:hypothetical protein